MVQKKRLRSPKKLGHHQGKLFHHQQSLRAPQEAAKEVIHFLKAIVASAIMPDMRQFTKEAVHTGQEILYQTQDVMLARLYALAMLGAGGIVIVVALVYLAETYLAFPRAWALLTLGLLLIAGSHLLQTRIKHKQYYVFK